MREDLEDRGFAITVPQYTLFQAKKEGVSCTFYQSGKLVIQGKGADELIEFYVEPEILKEAAFYGHHADAAPHIGADESGKGDLFGALCVVSLYADREGISKLISLGVQDSKKVADKKAIELGNKIMAEFSYHSVVIGPKKYNEIYAKIGNLNTLLAWAHATAIRNMVEKSGCRQVILDQFANERVMLNAFQGNMEGIELVQRTKAEEDIVVAGASIIARKLFLDSLVYLSKQAGITIPKGAGKDANEAVRQLVKLHGAAFLRDVAKCHFKNLDQILRGE